MSNQSNIKDGSFMSCSSPMSISSSLSSSTMKQEEVDKVRVLLLFSDCLYKDVLRLDHRSEMDALRASVKESKKHIHFKADHASKQTLIDNLITFHPNVIHIGGHGDDKGLQFEDGYCAPQIITPNDISSISKSNPTNNLKIAFISACMQIRTSWYLICKCRSSSCNMYKV